MDEKRKRFIARVLSIFLRPKVSSGVCGGITYGYGKLDRNGYWEYMLRIDYT